ncbi:cytochrome b, partial [Burkholderia pseudomallei]
MASCSSTASPAAASTRPANALPCPIALHSVCGFALGWVMTSIPGFTPAKLTYSAWHKWIGVTGRAIAIVRGLWRATHVP